MDLTREQALALLQKYNHEPFHIQHALTVEGDSMIEGGILDGDTAIIRKAENANNGEIVVALIDDCEATLKVLKKEKNEILLIPQNHTYETRHFSPDRVKIQGILSGIIRNYH